MKENTDPALLNTPLHKLKAGEFAYVERVFSENKSFSFTGLEHVESTADVAYIFKELENVSIENAFIVFVKDGVTTVQHLGLGGYFRAYINTPAVWELYKHLNPDKVYFVHNHPSGKLEASVEDQNVLKSLRHIFGEKLEPGIIINLKSGQFGEFTEDICLEHNNIAKEAGGVPLKVFSFDKQVFCSDYDPQKLFKIHSAEDVASFLSSHRLGDRKKVNFLVLNNQNQIIGNFFTGYTKITDKNVEKFAEYIVYHLNRFGGINAIVYGDFQLHFEMVIKLKKLVMEKSGNAFRLNDIIKCYGNNSIASVSENEAEYRNQEKCSLQNQRDIKSIVQENIEQRLNKEMGMKRDSCSVMNDQEKDINFSKLKKVLDQFEGRITLKNPITISCNSMEGKTELKYIEKMGKSWQIFDDFMNCHTISRMNKREMKNIYNQLTINEQQSMPLEHNQKDKTKIGQKSIRKNTMH